MKNIIWIVSIIAATSCYGQIKETKSGTLYYERVFEVDSMKQKTIAAAVKEWVALSFNNSNNVIKLSTDDKLIVKGISSVYERYQNTIADGKIEFDLIAEFKDNKYRLQISRINYRKEVLDNYYPVTYYPAEQTAEEFKKVMEVAVDNMSDGALKKEKQRILKNPDKYFNYYRSFMDDWRSIHNAAANEASSMAGSIYKKVIEFKDKKDW